MAGGRRFNNGIARSSLVPCIVCCEEEVHEVIAAHCCVGKKVQHGMLILSGGSPFFTPPQHLAASDPNPIPLPPREDISPHLGPGCPPPHLLNCRPPDGEES